MKLKPVFVKVMRITFLQLTIIFALLGTAIAKDGKTQDKLKQKSSFNHVNITLGDFFKELEKDYGLNFVYSPRLVDIHQKVNVFSQQRTIKETLEKVLIPLSLNFETLDDVIVIRNLVNTKSQSTIDYIKISGKVVDEKTGDPIQGVTINIKGSSKSTVTDKDGIYSIEINSASSILVFSFIGYDNQERTPGNSNIVNVVMKERNNSLNDVVVIGFGSERKSKVTGAIGSISSKNIENQQITRLDDALRGQIAGVNVTQSSGAPGSSPSVNIRGVTSINNSTPLYVIDGVVIDNGGLDNINPGDIETIDVLKDASAAIYGSRASAGVVIVTTKKGKKGTPILSYSGYYGLQNPIKKIKMANASQYATLRNESLTNDGKAIQFADPNSFGEGTNWQDVLFGKNVPIQNHSLSVSGANEKATYYMSAGYLDNDGIITPKIANYKRGNFTVNTSYKVSDWLTIGQNLNLSTTKTQLAVNTNSLGANGPISSALMMDPITPIVVKDINAQPNAVIYQNYAQYMVYNDQGLPYGISPYIQNEANNIAAYVKINEGGYSWATNILGNAYVEIKPLAGLKLRSQISVKASYYGANSFTPEYYLSSGTNNLTAPIQNISSNRNITLNWDNTASYNKEFSKHSLTVLIGNSIQSENGHSLGGQFIDEPINTFAQASPNYSLSAANRIASGSDNQPYKLASYFSRISYSYDAKYLADITLRRDGSSKFGSANKFGFFPSASVGYVLSREQFMKKLSFINFFKLRASYGVLGNEQSLSVFQYTSTIASGANYLFGNSNVNIGYVTSGLSNPDLKWEQVKMANIGFDAVFLNRLNITMDFYKKTTNGMIQQIIIPGYIGTSSNPYSNIGNLQNKGIEFSANYSFNLGNVDVNLGGNISYNKNRVSYLGTTQYYASGGLTGTSYELERTTVGQPYKSFYGFIEQGVFHSQEEINSYVNSAGTLIQPNAKPGDFKWTDINEDGKIDGNDRTYLGNSVAPYSYGFNLNLAYANFDLKIFGQGVWGNKLFQVYHRPDYPTSNYLLVSMNSWTPDNPSSNYPRLSDQDLNNNFKNPSNFFLHNGAYLRLKTIQLGYSIPDKIISKVHLKKVRAYISANNLFTITKYTGFDPEIAGGADYSIYPQAKTYIFGINVTL